MAADPTFLVPRGTASITPWASERGDGRVEYVVSDELAPSATDTMRRSGITPRIAVESVRVLPAPADVAFHLDIERARPVVTLRRRFAVEDTPVMWTTAYLRADLVPGIEARLADGRSVYRTIVDDHGLVPRRRWSRAGLEIPPDPVVNALELHGRPLTWLMEGVDEDRARPAVAIEFTRTWMRADAVNVVFEMGRPPEVVS